MGNKKFYGANYRLPQPGIDFMTPSRFDYTKYDEQANADQAAFKLDVTFLESRINASVQCPRSKVLALTKLEEVYMWIGKGIRNDQIARNGSAELQEERVNS